MTLTTSTSQQPISADLIVFTWNLDSNLEAAKLAISHLESRIESGNDCIAAFQEPPSGMDGLLAASTKLHAHTSVTNVGDSERKPYNLVASSKSVVLDPEGPRHTNNPFIDKEKRCEGVTFATAQWQGLRFLAVHAWDQINRGSSFRRGNWGTLIRGILNAFYDGGPLIVAGDLNANPWDDEITYRDGWFAGRVAEQRSREKYQLANREQYARPLFNLMWKIVANERSPGTLYYQNESDMVWHCLDQVLVSKDVFSPEISVCVVDNLNDIALVDDGGEPICQKTSSGAYEYVYSDHLPVEVRIPGQLLQNMNPKGKAVRQIKIPKKRSAA